MHLDGEGLVEMFCWETAPGYAVHLLNYNNPNAHHGWMRSVYPLGPQTIRMKLPASLKVRSVRFAAGGTSVSFLLEAQVLRFTVPEEKDYEVAAVTIA